MVDNKWRWVFLIVLLIPALFSSDGNNFIIFYQFVKQTLYGFAYEVLSNKVDLL